MNDAHPVHHWHEVLKAGDPSRVPDLLADEVVFHSPVVHTPQEGKPITTMYLQAAFEVLFGSEFRYVREVLSPGEAVLEFETEIDGIHVNGVDMIRYDADGKIVDFKVMVRPLKAIQMLHAKMGEMLARMQKAS